MLINLLTNAHSELINYPVSNYFLTWFLKGTAYFKDQLTLTLDIDDSAMAMESCACGFGYRTNYVHAFAVCYRLISGYTEVLNR